MIKLADHVKCVVKNESEEKWRPDRAKRLDYLLNNLYLEISKKFMVENWRRNRTASSHKVPQSIDLHPFLERVRQKVSTLQYIGTSFNYISQLAPFCPTPTPLSTFNHFSILLLLSNSLSYITISLLFAI